MHGRLAPEEKDKVMLAFAGGLVDVLVTTTVVEVGVDVPNATVMVIMDADRFGVSQLHQLRGRVGRGSHGGLCLLVTEVSEESPARERLAAVASTTDGFVLSRIDLSQRREGDVLGTAQGAAGPACGCCDCWRTRTLSARPGKRPLRWSAPTRRSLRSRVWRPRCWRWPSKNAPRSWKKPEPTMTRIIAGQAGGRRLATAPGRATRPTSDRTREGLFGTVLAVRGSLDGASVADLYAGSGAVGLEALSRGAAEVLLIESDPRAAAVIRTNIAALGLAGAVLTTGSVERVLALGPGGARPRDFVFADPPYALAGERAGARADAPARARLARGRCPGRGGAGDPVRAADMAFRVRTGQVA